MSKVQLQGNASGTGIFTIASPNSNTDRTLTLPDNTGTLLSNGSNSNFPTGSILQVVQAQTTTAVTTTTTTWVDLFSASITPKSASSKIYAIWSVGLFASYNSIGELQLLRGSTAVSVNGFPLHISGAVGAYVLSYQGNSYLDSPATTSSTTYKIQVRTRTGTVNWIYADGNGQMNGTITLMEVAG